MKLFIEIAIGVNVALGLIALWAYLFSRKRYWPFIEALFDLLSQG